MSITPRMWREVPDSKGYTPDLDLIGTQYVHFKGTVYRIVGFIFDAEYDLWKIEYSPENNTEADPVARHMRFTRSPENFFGKNDEGETRFRRMNPGAPKVTYRSRGGSVDNLIISGGSHDRHDHPQDKVGEYRG